MIRPLAAALLALSASVALAGDPPSIEDVAFFPESGWNRGDAVLQLSTFVSGDRTAHEIGQEWATSSRRHQLSYVVPMYDEGTDQSLGDATLNYRYQLIGSANSSFALAPRLSVILPTRPAEDGAREGGVQFNVPFSVALTSHVASHSSIGATWFSEGRESEWTATQSFSLAVTERITLSLDGASTRTASGDRVSVIRPGVQFAFEAPGGLTVAPGIAFPNGRGALFFIALERPIAIAKSR